MDFVLIGSVLLGLVILVFLVVIHELGHAIAARRNGVVVEEFGIGFPPRAWSRKLKNGVLFSLNWLPLGGFVKLQGEHDNDDKKGDFGAASFWAKTKIMLAGVAINWLAAAAIFTVLAWVGLPQMLPNQFTVAGDTKQNTAPLTVSEVIKNSPAERAGFRQGDIIKSINGDPNKAYIGVASQATKENAGKTIPIEYSRSGETSTLQVTLADGATAQKTGYLGVRFTQDQIVRHSSWSAPVVGVGVTAQLSWETLKGVGVIFEKLGSAVFGSLNPNPQAREQASSDLETVKTGVSGPIGLLGSIFPSFVREGPVAILLITAIISLTLAVMNILPIPALDGGRFYTMALFRLIKKPLTQELEEKINAVGMLLLLGLIVLVTISDVYKLF